MVKPAEFATALHYFTGSKDHNVRLRQLAKDRGEKVSEYGVENLETGEVKTFETGRISILLIWSTVYIRAEN